MKVAVLGGGPSGAFAAERLAAAGVRTVLIDENCVLATRARNPLRSAGTALTPRDTMCALGYFAPGTRENIDIQFLENLEGYIWVFPVPRKDSIA